MSDHYAEIDPDTGEYPPTREQELNEKIGELCGEVERLRHIADANEVAFRETSEIARVLRRNKADRFQEAIERHRRVCLGMYPEGGRPVDRELWAALDGGDR